MIDMAKIREVTPLGLKDLEAIRARLKEFLDANRGDFIVKKRGKITEVTYIGTS